MNISENLLSWALRSMTKLFSLTLDSAANRLEAKHGLENLHRHATKYQGFIYTSCNLCCRQIGTEHHTEKTSTIL